MLLCSKLKKCGISTRDSVRESTSAGIHTASFNVEASVTREQLPPLRDQVTSKPQMPR
jgi:hypothetical protein